MTATQTPGGDHGDDWKWPLCKHQALGSSGNLFENILSYVGAFFIFFPWVYILISLGSSDKFWCWFGGSGHLVISLVQCIGRKSNTCWMWNQILRLSFQFSWRLLKISTGSFTIRYLMMVQIVSNSINETQLWYWTPPIHNTSILRMWLSFDFEQGDYEMESGRLPLPIMNRFHQDEKALHQVCFSRFCCRCCP